MRDVLEKDMLNTLAANFKAAKAGHMAEFPRLSITMVSEAPVEETQT